MQRNLRYAVRAIVRTPVFSLTVVLTLALGIGANSAVFSAIDAILLRPLSFPDGHRLMRLAQRLETGSDVSIAPPRLLDWDRLNSSFQAITGYYMEDVSETSGDLPEKVRRASVTPGFLEVWGINPALGRDFTPAEHNFGGPAAVLISDRYWQRRFAADPNVLQKSVRVGQLSFPVVGVMPASFRFSDRDVDLWFPVPVNAPYAQSRLFGWYVGVGRLNPGVTVEQARANLATVQRQLGEQFPATDRKITVDVVPLKDTTVEGIRASLWLLFGAVSVLLLIACTNIAALLLSRAAQRQQEIAVRLSLGASRISVIGQTLTETGVLAIAGAGAGLVIAIGASNAFRVIAPNLPRMDEVSFGWRIFAYTLVCTLAVTLICGLLPATRSARGGIAGTMVEAGRTQVSVRNTLHWLLVGVQVALSVTLLAGAGLLLRSLQELSRVNPGFEAGRVLAFRISGSFGETGDYGRVLQRIEGTLTQLRTLPGVDDAATSMTLPGVPGQFESEFLLAEGRAESDPRMLAESRSVSSSYFSTLQIPLLAGEPCRSRTLNAPSDVMVNRSFADRYLSGSAAIGRHVTTAAQAASNFPPGRITGIVGDARERGINRDPAPTVYFCFAAPTPMPQFLVRTRSDPAAIAASVRRKIKEIEPLRSVYDMKPLDEWIGDAFAQDRLRTILLALFAVTALSLACVGLYGTLSYIVSLRRREVGLRLALGALRGTIVQQFLMKGLAVVGVACLCGLALSLLSSRLVSGVLHGVSPSDPLTLSTVVIVVLAVSSVALAVPALRAAFVEPMDVLRDE